MEKDCTSWSTFIFILLFTLSSSIALANDCQKCDKKFPAKYQYCPYHGIKLSQECPKCNKRMKLSWKYCPHDGTSLNSKNKVEKGKKEDSSNKKILAKKKNQKEKKEVKKTKNPPQKSTSQKEKDKKEKASVPLKKNLTSKEKKSQNASSTEKKKTENYSPREADIHGLAAVDLVKKFIQAVISHDRDLVSTIIDWEVFFRNFLESKDGLKADEIPKDKWAELKGDFRKRILSRLLSKKNIATLKKFSKRHYLLRMDERQKIEVVVYARSGSRSLKTIFTLKRMGSFYKIVFIKS